MDVDSNAVETITLILGDARIDVCKKKLTQESRYFSSLFSHNFSDYKQKEHVIKYDVNLTTLQNFVSWIEDEQFCHSEYFGKSCMIRFFDDNFSELINLLQLSVLFVTDNLTENITDIIIQKWLHPNKVIDIWLLAQEIGLNILRDISFSVCLDRFNELPLNAILELTKDNFVKLIWNRNLRCSQSKLETIGNALRKNHLETDVIEMKKSIGPDYLPCMTGYKFYDVHRREMQVYCWNRKRLDKLLELNSTGYSGRDIVGMQVTGRGFNIYTIGGEKGLGTGQFNMVIQRYCLISKKWYHQARLPVPRRHMVTAFLDNKLVIVGGVGRHRLKLSSMDILDIYTGKWTKGPDVPEQFTEVPAHCVMGGKLFILKTCIYIYYPESGFWQLIATCSIPDVHNLDAFVSYKDHLFLIEHLPLGETMLSKITCSQKEECDVDGCLQEHDQIHVSNCWLVHCNETFELKTTVVNDTQILTLDLDRKGDKSMRLRSHTERRDDLYDVTFNPKLGLFKIIAPDSLYAELT